MGVKHILQENLGRIFTFFILLSVILIVLNLSIRKKTDYFIKFKIRDVVTVNLDSPEGHLTIRKGASDAESEWMVDHDGKTSKMDYRVPLAYFSVLARIEVVEKFPISEFGPSQQEQIFETNAKGKISIASTSGKPITIIIGQATPSGSELYALSSANPGTVFTISNRYETLLFPSLNELRQRQMVDISNASNIILKTLNSEIELLHKDGKWASRDNRLDDATLQELLKALKGVSFENYFPDVPENELAQYGLLVPDITVINTTQSSQHEEIILSRYGFRFYMTSAHGEKRDVYILNYKPAAALESLLLKIEK